MWKLRQLQAQLSAAVSRVAELEAEAAQDEPLAPEDSFYMRYSKICEDSRIWDLLASFWFLLQVRIR